MGVVVHWLRVMEFVFWSVVKDKSAAAAKKAKKRLDKADGRNKLMRLSKLTDGVMVAQVTLDHSVWVRVLVPEPNGAMVKRLRRRPLKAKSRVRFPLALPEVNADAYASAFFIV